MKVGALRGNVGVVVETMLLFTLEVVVVLETEGVHVTKMNVLITSKAHRIGQLFFMKSPDNLYLIGVYYKKNEVPIK